MGIMIVVYAPDDEKSKILSDTKIEQFVDDTINDFYTIENNEEEFIVTVGNEIIIHYFRVAIKEGKIPHTSIKLLFNDSVLDVDVNGKVNTWPKGFCDTVDDYLDRLLGW